MKALWVILRKELLDAFRDRRMVLVAFVIMPLAIPTVLAVTSALGARQQVAQLESTLEAAGEWCAARTEPHGVAGFAQPAHRRGARRSAASGARADGST